MSDHEIHGHDDSENHGHTLECQMDGCAGHVVTESATDDLGEWMAIPNPGLDDWKAEIESSGKGRFVDLTTRGDPR